MAPGPAQAAGAGAEAAWARSLSTLLRSTPWVEPALDAADWLIPMPLSSERLSERGFNQALLLARALDQLDFMVSLDIYLNETTRHADVILPAASPLERSHYDVAYYQFSIRNIANYSPPVFPLGDGRRPEWQPLLALTGSLQGRGAAVDVGQMDADNALPISIWDHLLFYGTESKGECILLTATLEARRWSSSLLTSKVDE